MMKQKKGLFTFKINESLLLSNLEYAKTQETLGINSYTNINNLSLDKKGNF